MPHLQWGRVGCSEAGYRQAVCRNQQCPEQQEQWSICSDVVQVGQLGCRVQRHAAKVVDTSALRNRASDTSGPAEGGLLTGKFEAQEPICPWACM